MLNLFDTLKGLIKSPSIYNDGFIFRLHSRWTVLVLFSCSLLLSARQYFGDPIQCIQRDVPNIEAVENFCWIHSTYILPDFWNATVGVQVAHPGIGNHVPGQKKVYHGYYQWVAIFLFLEGVLFYMPRYFWKMWEKGLIRQLTMNLHNPLLQTSESEKSFKLLINCLHSRWGHLDEYFRKYIFCEICLFLNDIIQIWLMDVFLGGAFTTFGIKVIQWSQWDQEYRNDPLVRAFPRMTKCLFHDFGSAGSVQKVDALCLLSLNVLNEKIFILLWFWMFILLILMLLILFYRLLIIAMPILRYCILVAKMPKTNKHALDKIVHRASVGDWFILYLLSKNIEPRYFALFIKKLSSVMDQNGYIPSRPSSSAFRENLDFV